MVESTAKRYSYLETLEQDVKCYTAATFLRPFPLFTDYLQKHGSVPTLAELGSAQVKSPKELTLLLEYVHVMRAIVKEGIVCFYRVKMSNYAFYHIHPSLELGHPATYNVNRFICVIGSLLYFNHKRFPEDKDL